MTTPYVPRPIEETRAILATRTKRRTRRCDPACPGWAVFQVAQRGGVLEIEACDECCAGLDINDDDVAALPEAIAALAFARATAKAAAT